MFWFDKEDDRALFVDKRRETHPIDIGTPGTIGRSPIVVNPDMLADFTSLPFPDDTFALVVFDPPHIERTAAKGLLTKKYGHLTGDWREILAGRLRGVLSGSQAAWNAHLQVVRDANTSPRHPRSHARETTLRPQRRRKVCDALGGLLEAEPAFSTHRHRTVRFADGVTTLAGVNGTAS